MFVRRRQLADWVARPDLYRWFAPVCWISVQNNQAKKRERKIQPLKFQFNLLHNAPNGIPEKRILYFCIALYYFILVEPRMSPAQYSLTSAESWLKAPFIHSLHLLKYELTYSLFFILTNIHIAAIVVVSTNIPFCKWINIYTMVNI